MCEHKILVHNNNGYLIRCNQCNNYQLGFGTTVICIDEKQMSVFKNNAQELKDSYKYDGFPEQKNIQLSVFSNHISMVVCYNELIRLMDILEEAEVAEEVEKILNQNHVHIL